MRWSHAAYGCAVPDKRQTSKQRRAARNRAYREAMTARRENATAEARERASRATSSSSSSSSGARAARGTTATGGVGTGAGVGRPPGFSGPGDIAVLLALVLAVFFAGVSMFVAFTSESVPVDHNGDAISSFPAVSREAYAVFEDAEVVDEKTTLTDAYGPVIPIFAVLPALVAVGAFVSHRRQPRSRPLTYALVAMALVSVFNLFAMYFLPALIALAVAGFQVRKTEAPAVRGGRRRPADEDEVIDVDEVDPEEDDLDDEYDEDEYDELEDEDVIDADADEEDLDDEDVETRPAGESADRDEEEDEDVLAGLEAEIEDEGEIEDEDEIEGEGDEPDAGRGGRRRRWSGGRSSGR
jgi:hypothetical protein